MNPSSPVEMEVVPTEAGYDRWAKFYDADDNPLVLIEGQHFGDLIGDVKGLTVADLGCGTGRQSLRLVAAGAYVTGVDFSEAMLKQARAKRGADAVTFIRHDVSQPSPLKSAAYDRVTCCLVLDHIRELDAFFLELRRLCKPTGFIAISVMHPAMSLRGVQARFTDPGSGRKISPASEVHQMSDYLMAALHAGLRLDYVSEYPMDSDLAAKSPRAQKYLDWPLLLLMRLLPARQTT